MTEKIVFWSIMMTGILIFLVTGACGPHIDTVTGPAQPPELTGVACEIVPIEKSETVYDGVMCPHANEVARGIESIDPPKIVCYRQKAVNCVK